MIVLFTDFGWNGPYVGQMKARLLDHAPSCTIIDLLHEVEPYDIRHGSYLLASYAKAFSPATVFLAVVDPGVGSEAREPVIVEADGRLFVGPGNGLFDQVVAQSANYRQWRIVWRPSQLSSTFHGRDLFAPAAAMLASGAQPETLAEPLCWQSQGWPEDIAEVIYIDPYGNCVTGLRAQQCAHLQSVTVNGTTLARQRTFADVAIGEPFFYGNANGMLEIAVREGRADHKLQLQIGSSITID